MAKNKTTETEVSVKDFIDRVEDETKRDDSYRIIKMMKEATGFEPKMWGPSIIGFGSYHYKYASGHEGDAPLIGFSPRKPQIVLYFSQDFENREKLLKEFGKHKSSKGCVYIKKLEDVDEGILKKMIALSVKHTKALYK
jgi:hypothetical protein